MKPAEIRQKLTGVFRDVFDFDERVLEPGMTASTVPGWDSLAHIRLMLSVEKSFGVKFTSSEIGNLKNVGDLETLVALKTAQA